jgi:hypothetical protein
VFPSKTGNVGNQTCKVEFSTIDSLKNINFRFVRRQKFHGCFQQKSSPGLAKSAQKKIIMFYILLHFVENKNSFVELWKIFFFIFFFRFFLQHRKSMITDSF